MWWAPTEVRALKRCPADDVVGEGTRNLRMWDPTWRNKSPGVCPWSHTLSWAFCLPVSVSYLTVAWTVLLHPSPCRPNPWAKEIDSLGYMSRLSLQWEERKWYPVYSCSCRAFVYAHGPRFNPQYCWKKIGEQTIWILTCYHKHCKYGCLRETSPCSIVWRSSCETC